MFHLKYSRFNSGSFLLIAPHENLFFARFISTVGNIFLKDNRYRPKSWNIFSKGYENIARKFLGERAQVHPRVCARQILIPRRQALITELLTKAIARGRMHCPPLSSDSATKKMHKRSNDSEVTFNLVAHADLYPIVYPLPLSSRMLHTDTTANSSWRRILFFHVPRDTSGNGVGVSVSKPFKDEASVFEIDYFEIR